MEQNSHKENDRRSRFSGEARARMTEENAYARAALKKEAEEYRKSHSAEYSDGKNQEKGVTEENKRTSEETEKVFRRKSSRADNDKKNINSESSAHTLSKKVRERSEKKTVSQKAEKIKNVGKSKAEKKSKEASGTSQGSRNERVRTSTQKRKKDKKRQNALIVISLFAGAACIIALLCVVVLKINTVEVVNTERYTASEVIQAAKIKEGSSMLLINSDKISSRIEKDLPYIEEAEIEREWPDKIVITLKDAVATLAIDTGSGYILLNDSCKVLDTSADFLVDTAAPLKGVVTGQCVPGETVNLSGDIKAEDIASLLSVLKNSGIKTLTSLDLTDPARTVMILDHRIEVELGLIGNADEKLLKFASRVIEETEKTDKTHEIIIDLTGEKEARVRVKDKNEVVFEEATSSGELFG